MLLLFTFLVTLKQFVGKPIYCWCPAEFTGAFEGYVNHFCWIRNTYFIPLSDVIPKEQRDKGQNEITYYQWVPVILLLQAFLFKLPNIIWRLLNRASGIPLEEICAKAEETQYELPGDRLNAIKNLAFLLDRWIEHRMKSANAQMEVNMKTSSLLSRVLIKIEGMYLTGLYSALKFAYLANVIGQFFILNAAMTSDYNLFGFEYVNMLFSGKTMNESPLFPKVTLCDFQVRQLENIQSWTVQCTLPINLFNEKIFTFLWFWLCILSIVCALDLAERIYTVLFKRSNYKFVKKYLPKSSNHTPNHSQKKNFAENYLKHDGCLIIRMIGSNSTDLVVSDLLDMMWHAFQRKIKENKNREKHLD